MPQPPEQPARPAWRDDPQSDFLVFQLIGLARAALGEQFDEEAGAEAYTAWLKRQARPKKRGAAAQPFQLPILRDPEHGTIATTALARRNCFIVHIDSEPFTAELSLTFDPEEPLLSGAVVTSFEGNIPDAIGMAAAWTEELLDFDLDELDLDGLDLADLNLPRDMFDPDESDDAPDPDAGPPGPSPAEIREVARIARAVRKRYATDDGPSLADRDRDWLEQRPQALWPMLDGALAACQASPRDDDLFASWLFLLSNQLEQIRYRAERGWDWAGDLLDDYQDRLIALTDDAKLNHADLFPLVAVLGQAKVAVKPALSEAVMTSGPGLDLPDTLPMQQSLDTTLRPMIDELARHADSPFDVMGALLESAGVAPPPLRAFMAHELALSPHAIMRDTVPLILLDQDAEVRRTTAAALEQMAAPDTMSPVALRRIIALRNWIPEADRAPVDQVIRKARLKGVSPAQWDEAPDLMIRASAFDGSGAQSLLAASKAGRTGAFCGLLLKQAFGIRDVWCDHEMPRRDIASAMADIQRKVGAPEVERSYLDVMVQHHIAVGLAHGNLPGPALLDFAEVVGGTDWKDRQLDPAAETAQLFDALPAAERSMDAVAASLRRSGAWMQDDKLGVSWFEDDAETRNFTAGLKGQRLDQAARAMLRGLLEQRREIWAERFLLLALWARAVKPGQKGPAWRDFVVLAHELLDGRNLAEIPVMTEIAGRSVAAARSGSW
jgi:hypothetical protein